MVDRDNQPERRSPEDATAGPPPIPESIGTPGLTGVAEEGGQLVRAGPSAESGALDTPERLGPVGSEATGRPAAPDATSDAAAPTAPAASAVAAPTVVVTRAAPATAPVSERPGESAAGRPVASRVRLAGHAVHPMLIVFPLGLLATSVVFDAMALATRDARFAIASSLTIPAGVAGGLAAGVVGLLDWLALPAGTRAKQIGRWHGLGNGAVTALFAVSWGLRRRRGTAVPHGPDVALELVGGRWPWSRAGWGANWCSAWASAFPPMPT